MTIPTPAPLASSCILVEDGHISGRVTHSQQPAPDGTPVTLIFTGGPLLKTLTHGGHYVLPLLARRCGEKLQWTSFQIYAGGQGQDVTPSNQDVHLDLVAPEIPPEAGTGTCDLLLGTISGRVTIQNNLVPNNTVVSAKAGAGAEQLIQTVYTTEGQYTVTSLGVHCSEHNQQTTTFVPMVLASSGVTVTLTPTQEVITKNITVP